METDYYEDLSVYEDSGYSLFKVCVDCLMAVAGYSSAETGDEGTDIAGEQLNNNNPEYRFTIPNIDQDDHKHFSHSGCDTCDSKLAGDRFTIVGEYVGN